MLILSKKNQNHSLATQTRVANELVYVEENDNAIMRRLENVAKSHDLSENEGKRLECYVIFEHATSLWLLQTVGLPKEMEEKIDVFATTMEDWLAKMIFLKMPNVNTAFPPLDRVPISLESETTVHLVVFGFSAQSEALVMNAALVAHYPNYSRDVRLRTRITIIDDNVFVGKEELTQRYVHLFENSFYRTIDLNDEKPHPLLHRPIYDQKRKDFVDIEWEFVNGNVRNEAVRQKLTEWCQNEHQCLTIAFCHDDQNRSFNEALGLPQTIYETGTPILCHLDESDIIRLTTSASPYSSILPFGKDLCDIQTLYTLKQLAQRVNYVYNHCFSLAPDAPITAPSDINEELLEEQWRKVGALPKQYSNIFNAMTLTTKMHSIGHSAEDWKEYYALTQTEINVLTEVEHNRWSVEELILGYRPVTDEEQSIIEKDITQKKVYRNRKIHYDIRAFDDLRSDSTGKNVNVYDMALTQGIPLIIKTCITD